MKRVALLLAVVALMSLAGCLEEPYISASPDGTLAMCYNSVLFIVSPDLTEARFVAENVYCAEFSPDGKQLFCVLGKRDEKGSEYVEYAITDLQGKVERTVERLAPGAESKGLPSTPRWSPDGQYVSFLRPGPDEKTPIELHIRGKRDLMVPGAAMGYSWSADSKRIAVAASSNWSVDAITLGTIQVWDVEKATQTEPAGILWSPWTWQAWASENELLFATFNVQFPVGDTNLDAIPLQIFRVGVDGKNLKAVLPAPGLSSGAIGMFDLSPDRKRLVYVVWTDSDIKSPNGRIFVANADGSGAAMQVDEREIYVCPRWIDNRRFVCVVRPRDADIAKTEPNIYVVEPGGKTVDVMQAIAPSLEKAQKALEAKRAAEAAASSASNLGSTP